MKSILLFVFVLIGTSATYSNAINGSTLMDFNDEVFSFTIKPAITSDYITIETNSKIKQSLVIKIIDNSGFIRVEKELHLNRQIDVSEFKKGSYLIKIYSGNNMAVQRFYKGRDGVHVK